MTVTVTTVELEYNGIVANVPINVPIPMYQLSDAYVLWGEDDAVAVSGVDYAVAWNDPVNPSYTTIIVMPRTPLLAKIGTGLNRIKVGRDTPFITDFDNDDAFVRDKIVHEVDRLWMGLQQVRYGGKITDAAGSDLSEGLVTSDPGGITKTLSNWMALLFENMTGAAYVDKSGTIVIGGMAQVLISANTNRRGFWVQNLSNDDLWINSLGTAEPTQPSIWMPAGAYYDPAPSPAPLTDISIYGATTGQAFAAREW